MIDASFGRRVLLILIIAGAFAAFGVLYAIGYGGAVSEEVARRAIDRLLKLYVPLFGLIGGFYFSEFGQSSMGTIRKTSKETFGLAVVFVGVWVALTPLFLALSETVESALRLLDSFDVFGSTIAVAALAFYFSKSAPEKR